MGRFLRSFILIFIGGVLWVNVVCAAGPASVYKVTVTKFELYNGTEWVTAFSGTSATLDIAAGSVGSSVGNFMSGLTVPDGTYTQVRVTPSGTFTIKGNDGANYTTATVGPFTGSVPTVNPALAAECTLTLGGVTAQTQDISATPIVVTDGVPNYKVRVSFDVSGAIGTVAGELFPNPPVVTMSLQ